MNGHEKPPPPPTRTSSAPSSLSRFLSSLTLVALGAVGGFGIFHSALEYRIQQTEHNHNATLAIVTDRFVKSEKERKRCIEIDSGRLQEISDLRGRLDAQHKSWYDLTAAQVSMVSKQQESTAQLQQYREVYERDQKTLASLKAVAEEKDRHLFVIQEDFQRYQRTKVELEAELKKIMDAKLKETGDLQARMQKKDSQLESRNIQVESLEQNLNHLSNQKAQLDKESRELQIRIRQKDDELESVKKHSDRLKNQTRSLEHDLAQMSNKMGEMGERIFEEGKERETLEMRIRQKDDELQSVKKNFDSLQNQKRSLDDDVANMRDKMSATRVQITEKDKELFKYREEEGDLETKLTNFREGMLGLLKEKIYEIQELDNRVELLKQEKADLELALDNWREGMLTLVKEKIETIEHLKSELAGSREAMETTMHEIELARSEQVEAEDFVREQLDTIDRNSDPEQEEMVQELMLEIEQVRAEFQESQDWVVAAMKEIEHVKSEQAESEDLIKEKTNEIRDLKLKITRNRESAKEEISKLEFHLAEARKSVKEKTNQIEDLNAHMGKFVVEINDLKSVLDETSVKANSMPGPVTSEMMIDHVQQRDGVMCRQLFGKGPYYVKFVIRLPPVESNGSGGIYEGEQNNTVFFVIELSFRKELPHSTYTFLTLVESNLYNDGSAFLSARDRGGFKIGSHHFTDAISLEQKLKPLGLTDESSLSFLETSTSSEVFLCGENSFGFIHRGPMLKFFLPKSDYDERAVVDNETDCFAQVIRGQENLQMIHSLLLESGGLLEIVSAKHLRVD